MDIKNFFDNIHRELVFDVFFCFFKFPYPVSEVLTDVCCRGDRLCQGALTSSYIAALCLFDIETKMVDRIQRKGVTYSRYVDDITVSSKSRDHDFSFIENIIKEALSTKDLPINHAKTEVNILTSKPLVVHSLRVNTPNARLPTSEIKKIRASVRHLEAAAQEPNYITLPIYRTEYNKCMGRVNKLKRLGHSQHASLINRLRKIKAKTTRSDLLVALKMLQNILKTSPARRKHYFFRRQRAQARTLLTLLKKNKKYNKRAVILLHHLNKT